MPNQEKYILVSLEKEKAKELVNVISNSEYIKRMR